MKRLWVAILALAWAWPALPQNESNVNARYKIESVAVEGYPEEKLSKGLRARLQELVGQQFSDERVRELARRLRNELPGRHVTQKVLRGVKAEHVRIVFEISLIRRERFDVAAVRGLYHSGQGWSGELNATLRAESHALSFGIVSDADALLERYAGLKARYENRSLGTNRIRLAFQFEDYHQVWNRATLEALEDSPDVPGAYRTRQNFQPQLTVLPGGGLRLSFGTSLQHFQTQFPAARTESSNAVIGTLRYDRCLEDRASNVHRFEAGYSLRAATKALDSDFAYARHQWDFRYTLSQGRSLVKAALLAGTLSGRAPLFERFTLGNSATLRGWHKFEVAPLGGERVIHGSLESGYGWLRVFYDVGALWDRGRDPDLKHSVGFALRSGDFFVALAFPIRAGRAEPILMTGLNF